MKNSFRFTRFSPLFIGLYVLTGAVILKLFYLQVISHGYYSDIAANTQQGSVTLPARRGEIIVYDYHSGEGYTLATNTTLSMIYADPSTIATSSNPTIVAETFAPLLFDLEQAKELDLIRYEEELEIINKIEDEALRNEAINKLIYKTDEELFADFQTELEGILGEKTRDVILYAENLDRETQEKVLNANIEGSELTDNANLYLYPKTITDLEKVAEQLAEIFGGEVDSIMSKLEGKNRYVELKRKLDPAISEQIEKILADDRTNAKIEERKPYFLGIGMKDEYFRFYPEQDLASQLLGYVNSAGQGVYGVEGTFDEILQGKDGIFTSQVDVYGNQITVGESILEDAVDGADITLTIDRAIQSEVENLLAAGVAEYRPDSGQVIVINPKTGAILAMAQYPTFNPNNYGEVFNKVEIEIPEDKKDFLVKAGSEEEPIYWYYLQVDPDVRIQVFPSQEEGKWYSYENLFGPEVYKNKMLQEFYEPGSVFKPLVVAAAMDAGEITPNSTFNDSGPIGVDFNVLSEEYDYYIETSNKEYHGVETMTQVLAHSCNTGMTYISKKLGPSLFYSYLKAFGFTERTNFGLNDEALGDLAYYKGWTESEMVTKSFGQGITLTPLQLAQAYTAIMNNGTMMKPYVIQEIKYPDGSIEKTSPQVVRQVVSADTADKVVAMMTDVVESYASISIPDHYFAGKSGTAQTYKNGQALSGVGTTIASFIGAGPIEDPEFLVIVKMDHPRSSQWAEATSGQVLRNIMSFLFDYYSIAPDKN